MNPSFQAKLAPLNAVVASQVPRDWTVGPEVTLSEIRKRTKDCCRNITATGFLHRKQNLVDWVNALWDIMAPKGTLNIAVPHGYNAWHDPFAVREITMETFSKFDDKGPQYDPACKPFTSIHQSLYGNDLHVRMIK